jgi:hypothetical protein
VAFCAKIYSVNNRRYVRNLEEERATKLRETFVDRPATRRQTVKWQWPSRMREAGQCVAVMYSSDKWQDPGDYQDYKHVAEDEQICFVRDGFIVDEDGDAMHLVGPMTDVNGSMPSCIAVLAPIIGIQLRLYRRGTEGHYLPEEGNLFQLNIPHAMLGAAIHPDSGERFLVVYSRDEVLCIITGKSLDVLHDGIVG